MMKAAALAAKGFKLLNGVSPEMTFPLGAGRYEVIFLVGRTPDRSGTMDSFTMAVIEAEALLEERADRVVIWDYKRDLAVARKEA